MLPAEDVKTAIAILQPKHDILIFSYVFRKSALCLLVRNVSRHDVL